MTNHQKQIDFIAGKLGPVESATISYDSRDFDDTEDYAIFVYAFDPFTNLVDAHRVLEAFKGGVSIFRHHNDCHWQVRLRHEHLSVFGKSFVEHPDFCTAVTTAALQAWGYGDD